jgi:PilZ domain-containing protein
LEATSEVQFMPQNVGRSLPDPSVFVSERRKEYRLDIQIPIVVSGIDSKKLNRFEVKTETKNVTRYGACFELARGLVRVGSTLSLVLENKFQAKCRVVWIDEAGDDSEVMGVEFLSMDGQWVLYDSK